MTPARQHRYRGRPTKLDQVARLRTDDEGRDYEVTVGEVMVESLAAGNYIETAAAMTGISKVSVYEWLKRGAAALAKEAMGRELDEQEQMHADFLNAVERAQGEAEARDVAQLALLARGGHVVRTVTRKMGPDGQLIEETTKEETLAPNAAVLTWRLERRFPDRYGRRERVEVSGPDGGPIPVEARAAALVEAARQFRGEVIEAEATDA